MLYEVQKNNDLLKVAPFQYTWNQRSQIEPTSLVHQHQNHRPYGSFSTTAAAADTDAGTEGLAGRALDFAGHTVAVAAVVAGDSSDRNQDSCSHQVRDRFPCLAGEIYLEDSSQPSQTIFLRGRSANSRKFLTIPLREKNERGEERKIWKSASKSRDLASGGKTPNESRRKKGRMIRSPRVDRGESLRQLKHRKSRRSRNCSVN